MDLLPAQINIKADFHDNSLLSSGLPRPFEVRVGEVNVHPLDIASVLNLFKSMDASIKVINK